MANEITLTAELGRPTGTRPSRRLRATGKIPGVVYGHGTEATSVIVDWRSLRAALTTDAGLNAVITLDVAGDKKLTLVKELQRHPIRRDVLHVDFLVVDRDTPVDVDVPIVLTGEVGDADLIVDQVLHSLPIQAKPQSIPNEIVVDITGLSADHPVHVSDLPLPAGVVATIDENEVVVHIAMPVRAEAEALEEAEEAGAEEAATETEEAAEAEAGADSDTDAEA